MSMHRQQAKKKVRVAQAVSLFFAAGAVATMVLPRFSEQPVIAAADPAVTTPVVPGSTARTTELRSEDLTSILGVMNTHVLVKERELPPVQPVQPDNPIANENTEHKDEPEVAGSWRFVGSMISTHSSAAIINDENNKQHVIFTGDKLNGTTLVAVNPDHVVLRDGDENSASRQLPLESRPDTLLPDAPSVMASTMGQNGQNELPPEYRNPPAEFASWPPAQQAEWSERRAQLVRQQQEMNQRNANAGKPPIPGNGRPVQRNTPQPANKQPAYPKDFKVTAAPGAQRAGGGRGGPRPVRLS